MELYSFFNSSASYRVRIALGLKGVPFKIIGVNIRKGDNRQSAYMELNPVGLVPTLVDGDVRIGQSLAIIDYLEQRFPKPPLYPADSRQRALAMEIASAIACDIHPINNMRVLRYLSDTLKVSDEQKNAWYAHWVAEGLGAVERLLGYADSGDYCIGKAPTIADCCLIPQWANAQRMGCDLLAYPRCRRVVEHCMLLPAFAAAAPAAQPDYIG